MGGGGGGLPSLRSSTPCCPFAAARPSILALSTPNDLSSPLVVQARASSDVAVAGAKLVAYDAHVAVLEQQVQALSGLTALLTALVHARAEEGQSGDPQLEPTAYNMGEVRKTVVDDFSCVTLSPLSLYPAWCVC